MNTRLITNPIILSSIGAVVVIAIGSTFYYKSATAVPDVTIASTVTQSGSDTVTGSGTVEPAENPDLAFASGGRVVSVYAKVGAHVGSGQTLASLDTSALTAQRAQAEANVDAANARLAEMLAGARQSDIAAKQTAIDSANNTLTNLYASAVTDILGSYDKAFSSLSLTDGLFNQPNSNNPSVLFSTTDNQTASAVLISRTTAKNDLATWATETSALSGNVSNAQVDAALVSALGHLRVVHTYADQLLTALLSAISSNSFSQTSINAGEASAGDYRDTINSLVNALQHDQQALTAAKIGVQSAQDALAQVTEGSTPEEITAQKAAIAAAQANVASIDAQIRNNVIVAPFSGTVASVRVKTGDIVTANTPALSLNPESALQILVYFSEIDITKLRVGESADVTLDAYGSDRIFKATLVSLDSAPSDASGTSGYKATLQFQKSDPAITSGMTANVTISLSQ